MKKFLLLAVLAVAGLSANAQLVRGTTFVRKESNTQWFSRIGMSFNNAAGEALKPWKDDYKYDIGAKVGYDISVGFQKPIAKSDVYWGMEFGLGTRGAKASLDEDGDKHNMSLLAHNVKISPITFGYKFGLTDNLKLDAHVGGYVSYDYFGTGKEDYDGNYGAGDDSSSIYDLESYNGLDAGIQAGIGVWFNRFNLDFTYQRGFINVSDDDDLRDDDGNQLSIYSSNFLIRLGIAFLSMMRYKIFILLLILVQTAVFADNKKAKTTDLTEWAESQSGKDREVIDGVKIFRPTDSDGKQMVSDFFDIAGVDKTTIFTKAMLFAIDNLEKDSELIETVESSACRFVIDKATTAGEGKDAMLFTYKLALQSANGILSFAAYDISVDYKEKGILPRHIAFEKLKPAEKPKHKDMVEAFSFQNSKFLKDMSEFVKTGECQPVTHWKEIENCEVVEGMNETEVKLAVGRPTHVRNSGDKVKWMIGYNLTVIFTDGKVSAVIK